MKIISNIIIRKLDPCYDPAEVVKDENEELPVKEWVAKYKNLVKSKSDIIWLLCNKLYMSERDMRLFAVWCAREALKLIDNPDPRSITACDIAERYANGEATFEELDAAMAIAAAAAASTAWSPAAESAVWAADYDIYSSANIAILAAAKAARATANAADRDAARDAQIDKLMTYF